jgi:hypothetical protein
MGKWKVFIGEKGEKVEKSSEKWHETCVKSNNVPEIFFYLAKIFIDWHGVCAK